MIDSNSTPPPFSYERYRLPGDAVEIMKYKLEAAEARIKELEQEVERISEERATENVLAEGHIARAIQQRDAMETDRDNWRAKAGG